MNCCRGGSQRFPVATLTVLMPQVLEYLCFAIWDNRGNYSTESTKWHLILNIKKKLKFREKKFKLKL